MTFRSSKRISCLFARADRFFAPTRDLREFGRRLTEDSAFAERNFAALPVQRQPVVLADSSSAECRHAPACVDDERTAADEADFAELARDNSGMGGSPADGGQYAVSHSEAFNVLGRSLGAHQNDRQALPGHFARVMGIESNASTCNPRRSGNRAGNRWRGRGEAPNAEQRLIELRNPLDSGRAIELSLLHQSDSDAQGGQRRALCRARLEKIKP